MQTTESAGLAIPSRTLTTSPEASSTPSITVMDTTQDAKVVTLVVALSVVGGFIIVAVLLLLLVGAIKGWKWKSHHQLM